MNKNWKLPSFMRKKELKQYELNGKVGFYVLDGEKFKNLFIAPEFRRNGLATQVIKKHIPDGITICTTKRSCSIKKLIIRLGFKPTGKIVDGKQSKLEVWASPDGKKKL